MRRTTNTSIFSGKYQKRARRKKILRGLGLTLLLLGILFLIFRNPILAKIEKVKLDILQENQQKEEMINNFPETPQGETVETPVVEIETPAEEETSVSVVLPSEKSLDLATMEEDGEVFFAPIENLPGFLGDVSPSRKLVTLMDAETQDLYLLDLDGTVTDITYKTYKSSTGYKESKERILGRVEGFVWTSQPKFLDEDTVVYLSQLPWFDERRFLYIVELAPLSHRNMQSVKGINITLKDLTEKGLEYESDGKTLFLTGEYKILR